jgi:predicted adenine nucleotide alpha hydrolase (AANH) superfamily ATPase
MLTMESLENCFKQAAEHGFKYIGVAVRLPNTKEKEVIINPAQNFEAKLEYYQKNYDENLSHKAVGDSLRIVGFTFGNSFGEIKNDLFL